MERKRFKVKKHFYLLFSIITSLVLITGCAANDVNNNNTNNDKVNNEVVEETTITISITKDEGEETLSEKEVEIEEGDILMDVLKEHYNIEEDGGFITEIDGVGPEADEQVAWMYFVNDEMAPVGANEYELKADDHVNFDLQAWE